jgi:hypothetical protein
MNCPLRRLTTALLVLSIATTSQAEIIGSPIHNDRERIAAYLDREEVGAELVRHGVSLEQAKARAAALSQDEAASLAGQIDSLPAGAGGNPIALVAAVVLVIVALPVLLVVGVIKVVTALNHAAAPAAAR